MEKDQILYLSRQDIESIALPMQEIIGVLEQMFVRGLRLSVRGFFDSYWTGPAQQEADKIVTDDFSQMEYYREVGYFKHTQQAYAELGDIIVGKTPGRESPNERILGVNLGIALEDIATASLIFKRACELQVGTWLPL